MLKPKRVIIATILGAVFGVVCWLLASSGGPLPGAFGALMNPPDKAVFAFWGTIVMGVIYAFLIELITSKLFKTPVKQL